MTGKAVNSPQTGTGRHALPTKFGSHLPAALYPNIKSAYPRTCGCRAKPNRRISAPVRSASLRTTRSVSGFILVSRPSSPWGLVFPAPSLVSGRGFQRGGTAVPPLCATRGYGGRVASPMFRVGVYGGGAFTLKAPSPCPIMGMSPCGSRELCESARRCRALSL